VSFHPNEVARRARVASGLLMATFAVLVGAFFRAQVLRHEQFALESEQNRLRAVPLPAPRGVIYDRAGRVLAENIPGYTVSLLAPSEDSLRAALARLGETIPLARGQVEGALRRFRREPQRPAVILPDAPFDVVSVLEERRILFPGLIIQSSPKRRYPEGAGVAAFIGYTGEINDAELAQDRFADYKPGQQVGKAGLEKQYEAELRGREGSRFVEVDARGRVVREGGARPEQAPAGGRPLQTNIDLDLQRFVVGIFGDSLQGGAVAIEPRTGEVLAIHTNPTYDPNRFIGGIPVDYFRELNTDPRRPQVNKAIQGTYDPGSTWKLATAVVALEDSVVTLDERMPTPCTGGYQFGNRRWRCWEQRGHGSLDLRRAIAVSCDVYFYQLGLQIGLSRLVAGGRTMLFGDRTGIDLPDEGRSRFPTSPAQAYYDRRYGPRGWSAGAAVLNLSIGQGENAQTVVNMARFYTALATDGHVARPEVVRRAPERTRIFRLTDAQMEALRLAMADVVTSRGTAASAAIRGVTLAGKTGTAQNAQDATRDHAWFVGFAPAEQPTIVVAVMIEFGLHGYRAARIASRIIEHHLKARVTELPRQEAD
jgi:penicillin-binding protein 2